MLTGPAKELRKITEALKAEGVFVKEVETLGLAFHSPALDPLLPELRQGTQAAPPDVSASFPHFNFLLILTTVIHPYKSSLSSIFIACMITKHRLLDKAAKPLTILRLFA
jgi:hypothetical protein